MMESAAEKRKEEQQKIEQREKEVEAKFLKLEQWKKELNDKIEKKARDVQAAKVKLFFMDCCKNCHSWEDSCLLFQYTGCK